MANDMTPKKKSNALTIIIIAVVVLLVIIVAVALTQKSEEKAQTNDVEEGEMINEEEMTNEEDMMTEEDLTTPEALQGAESKVEGGNLVSKENKVITNEGTEAKNDVEPMSPDAPQQTGPLDEEDLNEEVVRVGVSAAGWEPNNITVPADTPVTFSITSTDSYTHIFKFRDESLKAVAVGVGPGETRAITFQSPDTAGEYQFYCDVPGHAARGEVGTMIVQ